MAEHTGERVTNNFTRPCLECGLAVQTTDGVPQGHDCRPPGTWRSVVAQAYWAGFDQRAVSDHREIERLRERIGQLRLVISHLRGRRDRLTERRDRLRALVDDLLEIR